MNIGDMANKGMANAIKDWAKDHWRWIVFGLIAAICLWFIGQKVAAIGSGLAALWKWLFAAGKEKLLKIKIEREEKARDAARDDMVKEVVKEADGASNDDKEIDKAVEKKAKSDGDVSKDKEDVLKMLDDLDSQEAPDPDSCERCNNKIKHCVCPPSIRSR